MSVLEAARAELPRYAEVAEVLASEGLGAMAEHVGLPRVRSEGIDEERPLPHRVRRALERLGPAAIKLGQMLSTRPDLLPAEYREELRRLQDDVTPVPYSDVAAVIAAELGNPPHVVFAEFDERPFAAASIGQVHAARLIDGTRVAVKVQRPGVRALVEGDLDLLHRRAEWMVEHELVPAGIDLLEIVETFSDALRGELDYLAEARSAELFRAALSPDDVLVPRVHRMFTTRRVLTMDRVVGVPLNDLEALDAAGYDRKRLARTGMSIYLHQVFELGTFHADPHPGNLFALPDGRVGFTDFGRVGTVSPGVRDAVTDLLLALVDRDADLAADAVLSVSRGAAFADVAELRRDLGAIIGRYYGRSLARLDIAGFVTDLVRIARQQQLYVLPEFTFLVSVLAVLQGVGAQIDPELDFVEVARPYARRIGNEIDSPAELWRETAGTVRRLIRTLPDLPAATERALRRVGEGEFRVAVRPEKVEPLMMRAEALVDRLSFALLVTGFVVALSNILRIGGLPGWATATVGVGLAVAVIVGIWLFASIFAARERSRRIR